MTVSRWLQPRDAATAARMVSTLSVVAGAVALIFALAQPDAYASAAAVAITVLVTLAVIAAGWMIRYVTAPPALVWTSCPFLAITLIVVLDVVADNHSVASQVFLFFPALFGASQLRWAGAGAVTAGAVIGEAVVVFTSTLPTHTAVTDLVYVAAAMITTTVLLVGATERQYLLVTQLQQQAALDSLTGLATRRVLDLTAQWALSGTAGGRGTALILLDVDEFKSVNDSYGHPGGDEVLIQLAGLLIAGCRPDDVVSRLGGDEIAILLPECSEQDLLRRADQILWDVRAHRFVLGSGEQLSISVSAGLAHAPTHAHDLRTLYVAADAALYEAKRDGRNRVAAARGPSTAVRHS